MTKYQGGYIGNTPGWANQNRSGVWNVAEQVSLKAKNQWPFEDGTIALRYILRNFSAVEGLSYDSGTITVQKDPDLIFWAVTGAGFTQAQGGFGSEFNGQPGEPPRGAIYLSWRRPLKIQVSSVNASGSITSISVQQLGKGLRSLNNNTTKELSTTSSGTGATFNLSRDASNLTTATLIGGGAGYSQGDLLEWSEVLGDGSGTTMDPYWDVILHGVAGKGGNSPMGLASSTRYTGGEGVASGSPAAAAGGNAYTLSYSSTGGGGGGGGWGGGAGGVGGSNTDSKGKSGFSPLNTTYVTNGAPSSINYGSRAIELLVNGVQVKLIANAIDSYSLANV